MIADRVGHTSHHLVAPFGQTLLELIAHLRRTIGNLVPYFAGQCGSLIANHRGLFGHLATQHTCLGSKIFETVFKTILERLLFAWCAHLVLLVVRWRGRRQRQRRDFTPVIDHTDNAGHATPGWCSIR